MKPLLIVIVGPTAIGKTSLSVDLALHFQTQIVSADSRQFYKEMSIGTAKPTFEEMEGVKHHFVDFLSIHEEYTAGQFEEQAMNVLLNIFKNNKVAIVVGGSGLFVNALCYGLDPIPRDLKIRNMLNGRFEKEGLAPLVIDLKKLDPAVCEEIDLQNPMRVIRALEVCLATGKPYSMFRKHKPKTRFFEVMIFGLRTERKVMYDRINNRCNIMFDMGWENEAKDLYPHRALNALNTVGYKELFSYFDDEYDMERCVELIKQHTRNFAKRQLTWFNKNKNTIWIDVQNENPFEVILSQIGER